MIKVKNLKFTYKKTGKEAIKKINFTIKKGEIFGLLGPSGAGKTTIQRLIIGLLKKYSGNIIIFDKERSEWNDKFYEKIGVAFDFPNFYIKLSAIENLRLISSYYKNGSNNYEKLLDEFGLLKDKDVKVENFSKGMKMRLNFIRSIMHNPDIIFLDEPTSGLDPVNAKIIRDKILEMKTLGKTIFLTTHNMDVAEKLCDNVAIINEGEIVEIDSPKKLMLKYGEPLVHIEYLDGEILKNELFNIRNLKNDIKYNAIIENNNIITIHSKEATLEEVFIKLTGRNLI